MSKELKEINAKYLSDSRKGISTGLQWVHNKELIKIHRE
jgi:hypothetical protein